MQFSLSSRRFGTVVLALALVGLCAAQIAWAKKKKTSAHRKATVAKTSQKTKQVAAAASKTKRGPASVAGRKVASSKRRKPRVNYSFPLASLPEAQGQVIMSFVQDVPRIIDEEGFCFMYGERVNCDQVLSFDYPACRLVVNNNNIPEIPAGFGARLGFVEPTSKPDNFVIMTRNSEWLVSIACTHGELMQTLGDIKVVFGKYIKFERGTRLTK